MYCMSIVFNIVVTDCPEKQKYQASDLAALYNTKYSKYCITAFIMLTNKGAMGAHHLGE